MARKPAVTLAVDAPKVRRKPEGFAGFSAARTCGNCEHFAAGAGGKAEGVCHNGISGRIKTTTKHGCGHGFYPSVARWPLKAGPGGVR